MIKNWNTASNIVILILLDILFTRYSDNYARGYALERDLDRISAIIRGTKPRIHAESLFNPFTSGMQLHSVLSHSAWCACVHTICCGVLHGDPR